MVSHLLGDAFSPYLVGLIADGIRGGHGLTPDALTKYTALEYALFVPNFFLILSGACYLLASFFVTDDAENCFLEIHRGQNRRAEIIGESYSHEETEEFPIVNAIVNAPIDIQTETQNPSTVIVASDPIDINDRNPLIRPQ
uniref:Uncharacterized protein n=1 Tax=Panagrolaimus sp. PS1159 TaxID=55785 RepID=A0AC35GEK0_9BILA